MKDRTIFFKPIFFLLMGMSIVMTIVSAFFDRKLFAICTGILFVGCIVTLILLRYFDRDIKKFLQYLGRSLSKIQEESLIDSPVAEIITQEDGEIVWYNNPAKDKVFAGKDVYGENIVTMLPNLSLTAKCPPEGLDVSVGERQFTLHLSASSGTENRMYVLTMIDDTQLKKYARDYFDSRPSVFIIMLDGHEDMAQLMKENERSRIVSEAEYKIEQFVEDNNGLFRRIDRDGYIAVIEERYMRSILAKRFQILDDVRNIQTGDRIPMTLSIGVGRGAANFREGEQMARQALDMALGRGGDQAAIKTPNGFEFYGGVSKGVEKRTKVKTRIVATALAELIDACDNVVVMGHHFADLDCFGSAVGMARAVKIRGKDVVVAVDKERNLARPLYDRLIQNGFENMFLNPTEVLPLITEKTLLIVVDTHIRHFLESEEIYKACKNVVVIDHHRKMVDHIDNAVIFYHEPHASSASEMVSELVQYFDDKYKLGRLEAEALLAGIMLDTKNFTIRTGVRTFEAAAYLRRLGADTVEVRKLFASSMDAYQRKTHLVASAEIYRGCAIAMTSDPIADIHVVAPQAADELLGISDVDASFVLYECDGGISYSARSMGNLNVQIIMESLGGGGHHTMAGAQVSGISMEDARQNLLEAIDQYYEKQNGLEKPAEDRQKPEQAKVQQPEAKIN